jgi:hypothetical protein
VSHRPYEVNSYSDGSGDIRTTNPASDQHNILRSP